MSKARALAAAGAADCATSKYELPTSADVTHSTTTDSHFHIVLFSRRNALLLILHFLLICRPFHPHRRRPTDLNSNQTFVCGSSQTIHTTLNAHHRHAAAIAKQGADAFSLCRKIL
jgi:hypothetical protein